MNQIVTLFAEMMPKSANTAFKKTENSELIINFGELLKKQEEEIPHLVLADNPLMVLQRIEDQSNTWGMTDNKSTSVQEITTGEIPVSEKLPSDISIPDAVQGDIQIAAETTSNQSISEQPVSQKPKQEQWVPDTSVSEKPFPEKSQLEPEIPVKEEKSESTHELLEQNTNLVQGNHTGEIQKPKQIKGISLPEPVAVEDLPEVVVKGIQQGKNNFEIKLNPVHLGEITIQVTQEEKGQAIISLVCKEPETLQVLTNNSKELAGLIETKLGTPCQIVNESPKSDYLEQQGEHSKEDQNQQQSKRQNQSKTRDQVGEEDFLHQLRLGLI
ncbi:flagellar hook-length control protein FliK [Aequitasia blattaphilus]|uniref:Flagellar hook-length control protein FliK n=1 Tax=Aequitasia blattaphilus TaxID=2949332 RepID=A0ABT1E9J8_9FIRM|nr:flagellar hook-length control protein FliK [Aequitasia blattaphilus]MCP1102508.1 flagellar hook-length control protein FliK [Aequitasia blattaphilus]MCR8615148.1 flagellar hook-length control protein FliK [Aequitasia blattaphilus]